MAEIAANDAAQRYAVIEQAYSKENWATVLGDGEELLAQLRPSDNPQLIGLQMRLQLLLGHTQLYGYGDKAAAAGFYGAVVAQSREAALTRIADQGLKQCGIDELPREAATPAEPTTAIGPAPDAGITSPAAPWLTTAPVTKPAVIAATTSAEPSPAAALETAPAYAAARAETVETVPMGAPAAPWNEPSLIPEVVEEPELIELHQADPTLAEELELSWKEPPPATAPLDMEDQELLSGLMLVKIS